jgi:uncharacterized protein
MTTTESFGEVQPGVFPPVQLHTFSDSTTEPFWEAARQDRLVVPRCTSCGTFRMPPFPICHVCQSDGVEWVELSGRGAVYSYTVVRHPLHPDLSAVVPYVSGIVELDGTQGEGARMLANIIGCEPEEIEIGMRVEILFDHVNDDLSVYRFRPIANKER